MEEDIACDLFIERLWAEAVGPWQIKHVRLQMGRHCFEQAFFALDGNARVVAHLCTKTGQRVEEGGFAAVGITRQHHNPAGTR
jgi:hypothetical protein